VIIIVAVVMVTIALYFIKTSTRTTPLSPVSLNSQWSNDVEQFFNRKTSSMPRFGGSI